MGFISAGKKVTRRGGSKKRGPEDDVEGRSSKAVRRKEVLSVATFEHFPPEILVEIYTMAGPSNGLPMVNRHMYNLLRYDPDEQYNEGVIMGLIRRYYLCDLNQRLLFTMIALKLNHYTRRLDQVRARQLQMSNNTGEQTFFRRIQSDLNIIQSSMREFLRDEQALAVIDEVFVNAFCNARLMGGLTYAKLLRKYGEYGKDGEGNDNQCQGGHRSHRGHEGHRGHGGHRGQSYEEYGGNHQEHRDHQIRGSLEHQNRDQINNNQTPNNFSRLQGSLVTILDRKSAQFQIISRANFLKYKFKEISTTLKAYEEFVHQGCPDHIHITIDENMVNEHQEAHMPLPEFDDENTVTGYLEESDEIRFDMKRIFGPKDLPVPFYTYGMVSIRTLELVHLLQRFNYKIFDKNKLLRATFQALDPDRAHRLATRGYSLSRVIDVVLEMATGSLTESTVVDMMKLCHYYEESVAMKEDLTRSLMRLLEDFYALEHSKAADEEIWRCVIDLKSSSLAHLLMQFNNNPNHSILLFLA